MLTSFVQGILEYKFNIHFLDLHLQNPKLNFCEIWDKLLQFLAVNLKRTSAQPEANLQ
jgi:hypothetical protein